MNSIKKLLIKFIIHLLYWSTLMPLSLLDGVFHGVFKFSFLKGVGRATADLLFAQMICRTMLDKIDDVFEEIKDENKDKDVSAD